MSKIGQAAFTWLEFDKSGSISTQQVANLQSLLSAPGVTDLVVISHGWKNTRQDAEELYKSLWENAGKNLPAGKEQNVVVAGIVWPAKEYSTDFDTASMVHGTGGGALAVQTVGGGAHDLDDEQFEALLEEFEKLIGEDARNVLAAARATKSGINATNASRLVELGATSVGMMVSADDTELESDRRVVLNAMSEPTNAQSLIAGLSSPPVLRVGDGVGKAQGLDDTVSSLVSGTKAAVARFLNQLTYYEMKKRAGVVGISLAKNVLRALAPSRGIKLHLVGHSFGARLVTATANENLGSGKLTLFSLTLLQGAFSHNGLAATFPVGMTGAFSKVVGKPSGPIAITHTHNDLACTLAYAIASRLSRDIANSVGDRNDKFGAMGANGPQHLSDHQIVASDTTSNFAPQREKVNTFLADKYIVKNGKTDAHNNVTNPTVGRLLAAVLDS